MQAWTEQPLEFACAGQRMLGVLARPAAPSRLGVLVVVGGPQYRAGSHRQFVLLARALAAAGVPVLRFDLRGMGDSDGSRTEFYDADADVDAALSAFQAALPGLERIVLWGLCDGATACALYPITDRRVAGLALVNPWLRTEQLAAQARLEHYYRKRLFDARFWRKLLQGRARVMRSLQGVLSAWRGSRAAALSSAAPTRARSWPADAVANLAQDDRPRLVVLSGRDAVAEEFRTAATRDARLDAALRAAVTERLDVAEANHTFSTSRTRAILFDGTLDWLLRRFADAQPAPQRPEAALTGS